MPQVIDFIEHKASDTREHHLSQIPESQAFSIWSQFCEMCARRQHGVRARVLWSDRRQHGITTMNVLTQSAMATLDELWASLHEQELQHPEPAYSASLWRMAGNVCTGYALQHATAADHDMAATFEWLALICDEHQLMILNPPALKISPLRLAIVQSMNDVKH